MAKKEKKIKIYADKLERDLLSRKWVILANALVYVALLGVIVFLATRGSIVVVGDNLVASGNAGYSMDSPEVLEIRADGHARLFYERFFTFDYNNFEEQKNRAIYLGAQSIEDVYLLLKKEGFYSEILNNHYRVISYLDSADVHTDGSRVEVTCYGRMTLTNGVYVENRRLDLNMTLSPIGFLKELNPFGLSIVRLGLASNEVMDVEVVD